MNFELNIDKLVLHGFSYADRFAIREAVSKELTRLFNERGAPPGWNQDLALAHIAGGAFEVAPDARPEIIGAQVAQAVYGGLNQSNATRPRSAHTAPFTAESLS